MPVLMYGSEKLFWKDKERSTVRVVQVDSLRGWLGIRKIDRVLNTRIRKLWGLKKCLDRRIDEDVFHGSAMWRGLTRESM